MVGAALRRAVLHMRRRHFALGVAHRARQKVAKAVMAGAHANKFQLAVTLRGTSGATGLRPLSLAWRDAMEQGGTARRAFHELLHCRHERGSSAILIGAVCSLKLAPTAFGASRRHPSGTTRSA